MRSRTEMTHAAAAVGVAEPAAATESTISRYYPQLHEACERLVVERGDEGRAYPPRAFPFAVLRSIPGGLSFSPRTSRGAISNCRGIDSASLLEVRRRGRRRACWLSPGHPPSRRHHRRVVLLTPTSATRDQPCGPRWPGRTGMDSRTRNRYGSAFYTEQSRYKIRLAPGPTPFGGRCQPIVTWQGDNGRR
jgi:hypothetical protein